MYINGVDYNVGKIYYIKAIEDENSEPGVFVHLVFNRDGLCGMFITKNGIRTIDLKTACVFVADYSYLGIDEIKSIILTLSERENQCVFVDINIKEILAAVAIQTVDFFVEEV